MQCRNEKGKNIFEMREKGALKLVELIAHSLI
jgi:hypothetical protein